MKLGFIDIRWKELLGRALKGPDLPKHSYAAGNFLTLA
jgi:hypothetical protein